MADRIEGGALDWLHLGTTGASERQSDALIELGLERYGWKKRYPMPTDVGWLERTVILRRADEPQTTTTVQAALDHPNLAAAAIMLDRAWPDMASQCRRVLQAVEIFVDTTTRETLLRTGCSCGPAGDRVSMEVQTTINGAVGMLEGVVHELGHNKLKFFGVSLYHWERLLENEAPSIERIEAGSWVDGVVGQSSDELLFLSPIRRDIPRPIGACWSAHYSYLHVCELLQRIVDAEIATAASLAPWIGIMKTRLEAGKALEAVLQKTREGEDFFAGQRLWADRLLAWEA